MNSNDVVQELLRIKAAIESIEVKGMSNAQFLVYACQHCDALVKNIQNGTITITQTGGEES